jgi:hypothetical protein
MNLFHIFILCAFVGRMPDLFCSQHFASFLSSQKTATTAKPKESTHNASESKKQDAIDIAASTAQANRSADESKPPEKETNSTCLASQAIPSSSQAIRELDQMIKELETAHIGQLNELNQINNDLGKLIDQLKKPGGEPEKSSIENKKTMETHVTIDAALSRDEESSRKINPLKIQSQNAQDSELRTAIDLLAAERNENKKLCERLVDAMLSREKAETEKTELSKKNEEFLKKIQELEKELRGAREQAKTFESSLSESFIKADIESKRSMFNWTSK